MYGLSSLFLLGSAILNGSAYARQNHRQGLSGNGPRHGGKHQQVPRESEYASPDVQSYAPPGYPPYPYGNPTSPIPSGPTGTGKPTARNPRPTYLYGTNAGGHLIVEKWMTPDLFEGTNATDQYTLDQTEGAEARVRKHWETYYTKDDFAAMKNWGLNAVRIPIGFWAYNNTGTPYLPGADEYMERMIGWCRELGLWVLVDCHGSPGSQNGFDNSGRSGIVRWQTDDNLNRSIAVLETMAAKYGSMAYADVVYGLQLVNEPISWNQSKLEVTQDWAEEAYWVVRDAAENKDLVITMHDGFEGPSRWVDVGGTINGYDGNSTTGTQGFALDTHLYQNQVPQDKNLTQPQHIEKACAWTHTNLLSQNESATLPVFVGEFSAATDICAYPNGTTGYGDTCDKDGCQCANNVPIQDWKQPLKDVTRKFFEAEVEAFEKGAQGWFIWSWKGPGGWGMENLIKNGVVGKDVHDREYERQCDGGH